MIYNTSIPSSECLKGYIKCFYNHQRDDSFTYIAMADIYPKLYFRLSGNTAEILPNGKTIDAPSAGVHGQRNSSQEYIFQNNFATFGVHLYPHAIPLIFNIPATEIQNQLIDLQTLLGFEGIKLECEILQAQTFLQRKKIIEDFILRKIILNYKNELPVFNAIDDIIKTKGVVNIKKIATDNYICERQFERQFNKFGGLNPKIFARIVRFKNSIEYVMQNQNQQHTLTQIAYSAGFYDQSHFIHDFKAFSGFKPKEFFSINSPVIILPN